MRAFGMLKTFKSDVRYCKIMVLRGSDKYRKYDEKGVPKWTPKVCQMEPLAANGRPRVDFATPGVDFEGCQKWVDFWSALGSPKSRWMLALGRQRGAKSPTTDGRALGEGYLLEKMAPRARLARAQLINKLIKLIKLIN